MAVDQAERYAAALRTGSDDQPAGEDGNAGPDAAGTDVGRIGGWGGRVQLRVVRRQGRHPDLPFLVTRGTAATVAAGIVVGLV